MTADGRMTIWMRLRNAREVIAGLRQTAAATSVLGSATERLATKLERAGRRTFIMGQAIYQLRRYTYLASLALGYGAIAVAKWGFAYNSQVQIAAVAFQQFGLSARGAQREVNFLFRKIAAPSPFLLQDVALGARRLMAFGLNLKDTNATILSITNALTAFGITTGAALSRATLALGHMMLIGRVTGQILYQLNRDNIPLTAALEKELGLTADQLRNVSALGIPAGVAIQALNKYLSETPRFQNAALVFSTKTWAGILSTTRDYISQFLGVVEKPLFNRMQRNARRFLSWLTSEQVNRFARRGDIAGVIGTFSPGASRLWKLLAMDLRAVWRILVNGVIPAFRTIISYIGPAIYVELYLISQAFAFLGRHTLLAKIFFGLLAAEMAAVIFRMLLLLPLQAIALFRLIAWNALQRIAIALGLIRIETIDLETGAMVTNSTVMKGNILVATRFGRRMGINNILARTSGIAYLRLRRYLSLLRKGYIEADFAQGIFSYGAKTAEGRVLMLRYRFRLAAAAVRSYAAALWLATRRMIVFLFTNPIGWAILLIGAMVILYLKWKAFHNIINKVAYFIIRHAFAVGAALTIAFGPIGAAVAGLILIIKYWSSIRHFFGGIFGGGGGGGTSLGGGPQYGRGAALGGGPHYGGVTQFGSSTASVRPLGSRGGGLGTINKLDGVAIHIDHKSTLNVDGKKMAEVVAKHRLDGQARR